MGCCPSRKGRRDDGSDDGSEHYDDVFSMDCGPDGPLSAAPAQLLVVGHFEATFNGIYHKEPDARNGKAHYKRRMERPGERCLFYCAGDDLGDLPAEIYSGWNFKDEGDKSWTFNLCGGPAYPPLGAGLGLELLQEH